ncbi:transcription factor bHLH95 [Mercurialis annua]|uniref:transcription factor bHLH95 n=1 Tax=Mercurialis annua TaxID=3986 RepID=UPI00215E04DD|nr:transcription factor bHLH95 [Mercurialis annua]
MSKQPHDNHFFWENQTWVVSSTSDNNTSTTEKKKNMADQDCNIKNNNKKRKIIINGKKSDHSSEEKEEKEGGGGESDHEIHIWTERERRKKMRTMFSNLHALLPQLPPKADKSTIVDEAVNYIKTLQQTLQKLQKQKLQKLQGGAIATNLNNEPPPPLIAESREAFLADQQGSLSNNNIITDNNNNKIERYDPVMFQTWTSSNVVLNICDGKAQISICSSKKPGLFTTICYVLEKHNIQILSAHLSSDSNRSTYMIQAHVNGGLNQFAESIPVEEIYREAASEIMCWVSS